MRGAVLLLLLIAGCAPQACSDADERSLAPVNLRAVVESVLKLVAKEVEARARLVLDLQDTAPVIGNEARLIQVVLNLIVNAYQALEGQGRLRVEAREARTAEEGALVPDTQHAVRSVVVDVVDNGPGIPPDKAEKIFQPFFTTKPQGSGLGLAIVRKIVDAHEGRIDLAPGDGSGACFRVTLPVEPAHKL